ncbi:heme/hemin ABC transporter substrate-binding protein [Sphingobacterium paludis]|uniref:Iron complex transport system substrate-binding protein n=1 Tax=Sphingobacterium paludis TaxID=1476465 RepID=A0A4R7CQL3_9SPHI|nr:ABC transporter substrate-binding protein [Sphingobacterium paludis]TDS07458.1 iron complex transport system substrate-binding protein [Sphingobacterium paludis]
MINRIAVIIMFFASTLMDVYGKETRIITLGSAITETVFGLGLGGHVVATDVTSISPRAAADLPKVSKNRSISAEGIMAFRPTIVLVPDGDMSLAVLKHVKAAGIHVIVFKQEFTANGAYRFIQQIADALNVSDSGKEVVSRTKVTMEKIAEIIAAEGGGKKRPTVLFIYARGTGTMSVSGKGSSLDALIRLAGGKNAVQEFAEFKPYSTEALVSANPDVILMFDFGLSSLGGKEAILNMPGVRLTEAGKQQRILSMNASLLVNFSTRLPEAVLALHQALTAVTP